jgi:hypothetical protein
MTRTVPCLRPLMIVALAVSTVVLTGCGHSDRETRTTTTQETTTTRPVESSSTTTTTQQTHP